MQIASRSGKSSWRLPALFGDAALATVVALVVAMAMRVASEPASLPPDALAYFLALIIGAMLLARRRWPLGVLLATALALLAYYALRYPGISPALPLAAALYTAASRGRLRWALGVSAFFIGAGLFVRGVREQAPILPLLANTSGELALLGVTALLGETVRSRRLRLAEAQERLRLAEAEREREAARRVAEERLHIARELHDVLAHTLTAITVQAGLALDVLGDHPDEARAALAAIRSASRAATGELRATVGMLRAGDTDEAPLVPAPGLGQLNGLLASARQAGLRIDLAVTGEPRPLPVALDRGAYRIVQEALTNVIRHAGTSSAIVRLSYEPEALILTIVDDGRDDPAAPPQAPGYGLVGMAERAAVLGGSLEAGPRPGGGFVVKARLPIEEEV